MKILIIDDEQDARTMLKDLVNRYHSNTTNAIILEADGVSSGIEIIKSNSPDLVFLDIHLGDGSGFDLLNAVDNRSFQLIFTSGYDQHAIKAFKYSAIDYLLKPIDPDDFATAMNKIATPVNLEQLNNRISHLETIAAENAFTKMAFPSKEGTRYIELSDIVHLESDGNYTTVFTNDEQNFVVTRIIKEFEEILPTKYFFRTHKSHIVNLKCINAFNKSSESLLLSNGQKIPVARRRKEELMSILN